MKSIDEFKGRVPDEVLERARVLWVTELASCPRRRQYRILGEVEELPDHYLQVLGKSGHSYIQKMLQGEQPELDFSAFPEAADELRLELEPCLTNFKAWLESTKIDLSDAQCEVLLEMPLEAGYILRGRIDLLTPTHIIDFKFSKKQNKREYRVQLAAYLRLAEAAGLGNRIPINVFLGGLKPVEFNPFENPRTSLQSALKLLDDLIYEQMRYTQRILEGGSAPCRIGFECAFCRYRHICRGV